MQKYTFEIKTLRGPKVSGINIMAKNQDTAMVRLSKMYPGCTIVKMGVYAENFTSLNSKEDGLLQEDLLSLIGKHA
jgi:hypothetical protein